MREKDIERKDIRKFGGIAFVFFGLLCALGIWTKKPVPTYFFGSLFAIGACLLVMPSQLKPVYIAWLKFGHMLGKITTLLLLTSAYYLVITPAGLIKRLFGGRPLPVKPDKKISTYWVDHVEMFDTKKDSFIYRY